MRKCIVGLLLALAACAPAGDPASSPTVITPLMLQPPPIYALLGYREDLSLTSEQITRLDSIALAVREENAPLVAELQERGREQGGRNRGFIVVDSLTQPLLERIRENNREARKQVEEVLTPEQEAATCRIFAETRRERMEQMQRRGQGGRVRGMMPDSLRGRMGGGIWPWCAPADTADAAQNGVPMRRYRTPSSPRA